MTREEKIRAIEDIKKGVPKKFALNRNKYKYLTRNQSEDFFWSSDGVKVTKDEQEKYFPDSILCINVSKQYHIGERGETIKIK